MSAGGGGVGESVKRSGDAERESPPAALSSSLPSSDSAPPNSRRGFRSCCGGDALLGEALLCWCGAFGCSAVHARAAQAAHGTATLGLYSLSSTLKRFAAAHCGHPGSGAVPKPGAGCSIGDYLPDLPRRRWRQTRVLPAGTRGTWWEIFYCTTLHAGFSDSVN